MTTRVPQELKLTQYYERLLTQFRINFSKYQDERMPSLEDGDSISYDHIYHHSNESRTHEHDNCDVECFKHTLRSPLNFWQLLLIFHRWIVFRQLILFVQCVI